MRQSKFKMNVCLLFLLILPLSYSNLIAGIKQLSFNCFAIDHTILLPASPETIYDAITGDISEWWDHSFSDKPAKLYIEARPGGGFYEIFNESGDGVLHATVIVADRGKLFRFDGPLGLSGKAVKAVHTYEFEPVGSDSTYLKFSAHFFGETEEGLPQTIESVWYHFLFERFRPYIEEGRYLNE